MPATTAAHYFYGKFSCLFGAAAEVLLQSHDPKGAVTRYRLNCPGAGEPPDFITAAGFQCPGLLLFHDPDFSCTCQICPRGANTAMAQRRLTFTYLLSMSLYSENSTFRRALRSWESLMLTSSSTSGPVYLTSYLTTQAC